MYNSSLEQSLSGSEKRNSLLESLTNSIGSSYDYTLFPAYYSPRLFEGSASASPTYRYSPPQTNSAKIPPFSPFYASLNKIGEFYGCSSASESQRTTSVIMKVEQQKVVEWKPKDFNARSSSESEDENIVCKWKYCYRHFDILEHLASHVAQSHAAPSSAGLYFCQWENCPRADRGFNARYKMLVHVRTHTKEKPHQCGECFKSFSRAENLKIHIRSHSGEKPYMCPVEGCNKAYSNSSDRFKHTRTHSTEKPYFCKFPSCNKRYTDPSSLRKHVKTFKHTTVTVDRPKPRQVAEIQTNATEPIATANYVEDSSPDPICDRPYTVQSPVVSPAEYRCSCAPYCVESYHHSGGELYKLDHLFNHSVNICSPHITMEDEIESDYWIKKKIALENKEFVDMDTPLDLSMHKSVR